MSKKGRKNELLKFCVYHPVVTHVLGVVFPKFKKSVDLFRRDLKAYELANETNFVINNEYMYPHLADRFEEAGVTGTYFWQDFWAARLISEKKPDEHFDIGSRIDGFIGHLACFMKNIHLIDIRPFEFNIPNVDFLQADATDLNGIANNSIDSISALCSLEHFGLGRYGDPIDPKACFKVMHSIDRVLASGGDAYISVPVGYERLEFNAFRVFYAKTIKEMFPHCDLVEYSVTDGTCIEKNVPIDKYDFEKENGGSRFGLFHFVKR